MIWFLLKGLLRDRHRSLLPLIVISIGVGLTVTLHAWLTGFFAESFIMSARFKTGHVKVMTRAYAADQSQMPLDLALTNLATLTAQLRKEMPEMDWTPRIRFGGLIDFPDQNHDTRAQGPVVGYAIDLLNPDSQEALRFNLAESLVEGRIPASRHEALLTHDFAQKFKVQPGDPFTFFGSTMEGGMAFYNFTVAGTVRFGSEALDHGAIIIDLGAGQQALVMEDAASEILGFFKTGLFDQRRAQTLAQTWNGQNRNVEEEFAPVMKTMREQEGMAEMMDYSRTISGIMSFIFVLAMSIVLWNTGLLGGLRRYNEFGVRLALGEEKRHVYKTLLYEAMLIGAIGSVMGTAIGIAVSWYLQAVGLDMGDAMKGSAMMMPSVVRARITSTTFWIGFIPGLFSMVLGNALSGIGIYQRNTAQLFKELEV